MNNLDNSLFCQLILILLTLFLATNLVAQDDSSLRLRGMFTAKTADGLEIKILKKSGSVLESVSSSYEFKTGDEIRLNFRSNFDGHVYFVNVAPSGISSVIHHALVKAEKENELPAAPDVIKFDHEVGAEVLKIVMSRDKISVFEDALKTNDGVLGKTSTSVAQELTARSLQIKSDPKGENVSIPEPKKETGIRCRGLSFDAQTQCREFQVANNNTQKNQSMVAVAIPDNSKEKNVDGKLKSGDVVVIDLELKHVQ